MKKGHWGAFTDMLFLLFAAGTIVGCVTANLLSGELLKQIGYFDSIYQWGQSMGMEERGKLWTYTIKRRFGEIGMGALAGMTPLAKWVFYGLSVIFGFNSGLIISTFTLESGWMGIFLFLRSVLPQWIFYGLSWIILAVGCENGLEKIKIRVWLFLIFIIFIGTFMETFFNF